jgi:hypothetical protein
MSVLETPRIYFRGQVAWDPITTNNYASFYSEDPSDTVFPDAPSKVAAFRQEAIDAVATKGNWNPHGTHRSTFFDASVTAADLGKGLITKDPFVSSPVSFIGMLVDAEPYGAYSSQLFFDKISFGIPGGCRIAGARNTRFTDRYINFARNMQGAIAGIASVVWQTTFRKEDGLTIDAFDSPALRALRKSLDDDDVLGLTVQWNSYRTIYYDNPATIDKTVMAKMAKELIDKLNTGGWQPNPARSMMVGVIGLWRDGEPAHEPGDRTLVATQPPIPRKPYIGSAHARFHGDRLTLDLSNSVNEDDLALTKHHFGDLSVVAVDASGSAKTLATFAYDDYDKDAYERTSGIVTLKAKHVAKLGARILQLRNAAGKVYLAEQPLRALPLVPNLYMNEGDVRTAEFQVYDRGVPAGAGIDVTVYTMSFDGNTVESSVTLTTGDDGRIAFPVSATPAGVRSYVAVAGPAPQPPSAGIDPQTNTYMYVRTLAADSEIAQLPPTWDNVYEHVLANWHGMAPCMDNWLNLGSEDQVIAFGTIIYQLTDEAAFESFRYMPVTRDLTPGRRALLYNFLANNNVQMPVQAPEPVKAKTFGVTAAEPSEEETEERPSFAKLSHRMRVPE